jgi:hypothetical protein
MQPRLKKRMPQAPGVSDWRADGTKGVAEYISFEKRLTRVIALYALIGNIEYRYDNGAYVETARGPGGKLGARIYPFKQALDGWCAGGGVRYWSAGGHWKKAGTPNASSGPTRSRLGGFNLQTGYKWRPGPATLFIDPQAQIGVIGGSSSEAFGFGPPFVAGLVAIGTSW